MLRTRTRHFGRTSRQASGRRRVSVGRLRYPRSSIFLNHWLIARTGEEVVAREVFDRFKRFADHDRDMSVILRHVRETSELYRQFIQPHRLCRANRSARALRLPHRCARERGDQAAGAVAARPGTAAIPAAQFIKALDVVESWMVRRMLVRATTKNYNQVVAEIVALHASRIAQAGSMIESYLAGKQSKPILARRCGGASGAKLLARIPRRLGRGRLRWCSRRSRITSAAGKTARVASLRTA